MWQPTPHHLVSITCQSKQDEALQQKTNGLQIMSQCFQLLKMFTLFNFKTCILKLLFKFVHYWSCLFMFHLKFTCRYLYKSLKNLEHPEVWSQCTNHRIKALIYLYKFLADIDFFFSLQVFLSLIILALYQRRRHTVCVEAAVSAVKGYT